MQAGTDETLIDASRSGDRAAFARVIERYHRAVYAVAFSNVRDRARADDITQDTFVLAWQRLGDLRDRERLGAWLCGIARNLARDARRRLQHESPGDVDVLIDTATPYEVLTDAESERLVATALEQVPDVYREPLVLYYYQDRSVEDVANALGITAATTNKRLSRGRRYLADRVAAIVEHGLARRGPSPALVGSVLAAIAVLGPAPHVDASPVVKGSTMSKLAIASFLAAAVTGGGLLVASTVRGTDAHAKASAAEVPAPTTHAAEEPCFADFARAAARRSTDDSTRASGPALRAASAPALPAGSSQSAAPANDCATVGRHLAELEADATHGPTHRPDEATCDKCASHYTSVCENDAWSAERRTCSLAAGDLVNAHLCAGTPSTAPAPSTGFAPELQCAALGQHIMTTVHAAGVYTEVKDMAQQVDSACQLGGWSLELRQCFRAASSIDALQACVTPTTPTKQP